MITSTADVIITNTSTRTLTGPLHAAIGISASGVQVPDALGGPETEPYGKYYYDLSDKLSGGILAPGDKVTFGVKFVRYYTVRFTYDILPYGPLPAPEEPAIQVSPASLDYGQVTVGDSAARPITVSNIGNATLSVTSIQSDEESFTVYPPTGFSVAPGASRLVNIGFSPATVGSASGAITITSDATNQNPVTVPVIGEGMAPTGAPILSAPTAIDFGPVMEGQTSTKDVTVSNIGTAPLIVSQTSLDGAAFVWPTTGAPILPFTLAPGQSANLQIVFAPESGTGGATLSGVLSLDSNGGNTEVALSGNAVAAVVVQTLNVLDARVKDGAVYDRITDSSCASVSGEVIFGDGVFPSDTFVVTLTDQTGATATSDLFLVPQTGNTATFSGIDACDLKDGIITVTVAFIHDGEIQGVMTGTPAAKNSSSLSAPVLDPIDPATVFSTIKICGTAPAGTLVRINGGAGLVSIQLSEDQTSFCLEVSLRRNTENILIVSAIDTDNGLVATAAPVKVTQVDPSSVLIAEASSRPLTQTEVETLVSKGVINLNDPSNFNVSMFTIVLTIGQFPVTITQPVAVNPTPGTISYGGGSWSSSTSVASSPVVSSGRSTQVVVVQTPTGQTIPGVIIIDGRIKTLKEFFQVTIAIQNTTAQFDLADMVADIALPAGLSPVKAGLGTDVATINTGNATDRVTIGAIGPQQTGTGQFIIRGDGIGKHDVTVNFQGFLSSGGLADPFPISGSAGTSVQVFGPPKLDVVVRHPGNPGSPEPDVTIGEIYTLTVDVTNRSPVPALYTSLDLLLGQGAVLVDADGNEIPDFSTVRTLGHIQPGQTASQAFRVKARLTGKIIACQAMTSENINLTVDIGGGSCNIVNTIPANFEFPPVNAPPTIMAINPLNNQPNVPITTSIAAILTPQAGCLTADTWDNVITDWIDPLDLGKGLQVISADLTSVGNFYLEEMDGNGNPIRHIPADLTVTPGVDGQTSIAVLRLGLASPLSQNFLKANTVYRATLIGGSEGICNANLNSVRLPNTYQWTFSTAQICSGIASPTVTLSQPTDGATDQPLNQKIVLNFSQRMNPASFTFDPSTFSNSSILLLAGGTTNGEDVIGGNPIPGTMVFSNLFQTLTFTPAGNLPAGESIYVRLKNTIKDVCGNSLQTPVSGIQLFSFTTTPPDTTPPNAPVANPLPTVTNQSSIQVSGFAEAGSLVTITGGTVTATATASSSGLFSTTVKLPRNTQSTLQITATDASDNVSTSVTVDKNGAALTVVQDAGSPMIVSATPAAGSTGVARDTAINVVFSKDINPGTVNSLNFSLTGTTTVSGTFTLNGTNGFTFTPAAPLDYGQIYTINMRAGGISDMVGNGLSSAFSSTFVAESFPFPTLTQLDPASGMQGTAFNVTFTGTHLATAGVVVSDNPGVNGVISGKTDTGVVASVTITPLATIGETTLGLTTNGGTVTLPFTVIQKPPVITTITSNQGTQGSTVAATITGSGLSNITDLSISGEGVTITDLGTGNDNHLNVQLTITAGAVAGDRTITVTTPSGVANVILTVVQSLPAIPAHMDATDPADEEFTIVSCCGSSSVEPIIDDLGHAAWSITNAARSSQFGYMSGGLSAAQKADIANRGFVLTLYARVQQGLAPAYDDTNHVVISAAMLETDSRRFEIDLGLDGNGDTVVVLSSAIDAYGPGNSIRAPGPSFTLPGSGSSYHTYQLIFNPNTQLANLYVDGVERIQDHSGHTSYAINRGVVWSTVSGGVGNFDYVDFTIGSQNLPAPILTKMNQTNATQGDTFNVTFNGTNLKTVNAVVSDNPGINGSIIDRSDTSVTAIITIDPQAETDVTTLGLSTLGGIAKWPFTINPSTPNIIDATYGIGAGSFELGNFVNGGGISYGSGARYMGVAPGDSTTITGWRVDGPGDGVDWLVAPYYRADNGIHSVDLQHLSPSSIFTEIPTVVGKSYVLSFRTATISGRTNTGVVSAGALANQPFAATYSSSGNNQTFTSFTFLFTATEPTTTIRFSSTGSTTCCYGPAIDSVSVIE